MSRRRIPRAVAVLALIAVAAFVFRAGYLVIAKIGEPPYGDAVYYRAQADVLAEGKWFVLNGEETAEHPPATALFLAPVSWVLRQFDPDTEDVMLLRFAMSAAGAVVVFVVGLIGRRVGGDRVGYLAAGIALLNPNLWVNDALLMSETLAALVVAVAILLAYRLGRDPTWPNAAWVGVACGVAGLVRSELLLLLPLMVFPVVWFARRTAAERLQLIGASMVAAIIAVSPWVLYNLSRFDESALFSTNDGLTLCGANVDSVYYGSGIGLWSYECALLERPPGDRSVQSNQLRDLAVDYVQDHWSRVPVVVLAREGRVWSLMDPSIMARYNEFEGREYAVSWLGVVAYWIMVPFAVGGAVLLRRRRIPITPLVAPVILVAITAALIYGLLRFRVPAEISIVVFTAVAVDHLWTRYTRERRTGEAVEPERVVPTMAGTDA